MENKSLTNPTVTANVFASNFDL